MKRKLLNAARKRPSAELEQCPREKWVGIVDYVGSSTHVPDDPGCRAQSTISIAVSGTWGNPVSSTVTDGRTNPRAGASGSGVVGAEHADAGTKFGSSQRDHVLAYVSSNDFAVLRVGVGEDILHEVVAILIAGDIDQGDPGSVDAALADAVEIPSKKLGTSNLETLLHNLGCKLIHAVLGSIADDVVNRATTIRRGSMFTDVLDAPVAKLAMSDDVDVREDLLDAGTL